MRSWCLFSPKIIFSSSKHIFRVSLLILWWRQVWLFVHKCHKSFMNTCLLTWHCLNFPHFSQSRCWLIDSGTASQQQQKRVKRHVTYHWPVSGLKTWSWKLWQPCFASLSPSEDLIMKAAKIEVNMSLGTLISRPREKFVKWQRTLVHTLGDPCVLTNFLSK